MHLSVLNIIYANSNHSAEAVLSMLNLAHFSFPELLTNKLNWH